MKIIKNTLLFLVLSYSLFSIAKIENKYDKIQSTFIEYSRSKGENITQINVSNFKKITQQEKNEMNLISRSKGEEIQSLINSIIENKWSNNKIIYNFNKNHTVFLYPLKLKPTFFNEGKCNYLSLISDNEACISLYIGVKSNIAEVFNNNGIYLDDNYLGDFIYIHELSHLLPIQRKVPIFDKTNVWVDDTVRHYGEIYSDLFSVIFLHNYMGYDESNIEDIIKLRNFKLYANNDLIHYSVPYIEFLLKDNNWKDLRSFEEIDEKIKNIYSSVNNRGIISKKRFKHIYYEYYNFCNDLNLNNAKSKNAINLFKQYCILSK